MRVGFDLLETRINAGFLSLVPEAGIEPARLAAGDFESPASTNFTTRAVCSEAPDYDTGICAAREQAVGVFNGLSRRFGAKDGLYGSIVKALGSGKACQASQIWQGRIAGNDVHGLS